MEQKAEQPRRVTPSDARLRLLQTLIAEKKLPLEAEEREKVDEARASFIQMMLRHE